MTDDAEVVLIGLGTVAMPGPHGRAPHARAGPQGRLRQPALVPPVPDDRAARAPAPLQGASASIDRDFAHGSPDDGGVLLHEIRSCLYPRASARLS